jgi:hypothetical protein
VLSATPVTQHKTHDNSPWQSGQRIAAQTPPFESAAAGLIAQPQPHQERRKSFTQTDLHRANPMRGLTVHRRTQQPT